MVKRIVISFLVTVFFARASWSMDTVIVHKDARMDVLTAKQAQINKKSSFLTSTGQYKGYRVQVVSTSNRDQAFKIKGELLSRFPDQKTYALFQSPNFKVRIGNFLKKPDAEKFKLQLTKLYTTGVFVVEDAIDYSPTKEEEDQLLNN
ncbi:MAG: SPOR domain-containing protein [Chitinophagaceae bacterium]|nr:SPOR domain-containing protein [Chitinophagaceae bacterium]